MANVHYAKIGDIWKHLPISQILSIEQPNFYAESHAGSAQYPLTHSKDRDYGVFHFLDHTKDSIALDNSAYAKLLRRFIENKPSMIYPGSPLMAMSLLTDKDSKFLFCDTDGKSIADITQSSKRLGLMDNAVTAVQGDGIDTISEALTSLSAKDALKTFVLIDPYQPLENSKNELTSLDLFCQAGRLKAKAVFWYGFNSMDDHSKLLDDIKQALISNKLSCSEHNLMLAEIKLSAFDNVYSNYNPGVLGCGIICCNLSKKSLLVCDELGRELEGIYNSATLGDGSSGAIEFTQTNLDPTLS